MGARKRDDPEHEAKCRLLGLLTPCEIRGLRKSLGLSRRDLADLTGFCEKSIKRWETGALLQNLSSDRFLRLLRLPQVMVELVRLEDEYEGGANDEN